RNLRRPDSPALPGPVRPRRPGPALRPHRSNRPPRRPARPRGQRRRQAGRGAVNGAVQEMSRAAERRPPGAVGTPPRRTEQKSGNLRRIVWSAGERRLVVTAGELRNLLCDLEDDAEVLVALMTAADGRRLLQLAVDDEESQDVAFRVAPRRVA